MINFNAPLSQDWLIDKMRLLRLPAQRKGVCFGFSMMMTQAILCGELDKFFKRLSLIAGTRDSDFVEFVNVANQKQKSIYEQAKKIALENLAVQSNLQIIDEKKLTDENRKKLNSLITTERDKLISTLSEKEQIILEIPAFFDGILVNQQPEVVEMSRNYFRLNPITQSINLVEMGGAVLIENFKVAGCYSAMTNELRLYVNTLADLLKNCQFPVAVNLQGHHHSIIITYDPESKKWIGGDINHTTTKLMSNEQIAQYIHQGFDKELYTIVGTQIFVAQKNESAFQKIYNAWKIPSEWKQIHSVTSEKVEASNAKKESYLRIAALMEDYNLTKQLLMAKSDPNVADVQGITALHIAIFQKNYAITQLLVSYGANIESKVENGITPLIVAVLNEDIEIASFLLKKGANVNKADNAQKTPLMHAISKGDYQMVKLLLAHKADIKAVDNEQKIPLFYADYPIAKLLLEEYKADPNAVDKNQISVLNYAIHKKDLKMAKLLVAAGAKFDKYSLPSSLLNKMTNLSSYISEKVDLALLTEFLPWEIKDTHENVKDVSGYFLRVTQHSAEKLMHYTPIMLAILVNDVATIKLLLKKGISPTQPCIKFSDGKTMTPRHVAASLENKELFQLFEQANYLEAMKKDDKAWYGAAKYFGDKNFLQQAYKINSDILQGMPRFLQEESLQFAEQKKRFYFNH